MKNIILFISLFSFTVAASQDVEKNIASARSAYEAGKLEDARSAMEQVLRELDIAIGKEIIALLPAKIGPYSAVAGEEGVHLAGSGLGLMLGRQYGTEAKGVRVDIANNSPLLGGLNSLLALPVFGAGNPDQKQVKVQGYKALLTRTAEENGKQNYSLQIPFGNNLLTMNAADATEADVLNYAAALPMSKIAAVTQ